MFSILGLHLLVLVSLWIQFTEILLQINDTENFRYVNIGIIGLCKSNQWNLCNIVNRLQNYKVVFKVLIAEIPLLCVIFTLKYSIAAHSHLYSNINL